MEHDLDLATDLALFAQVVRHGGLSAASRATGIPKSRLSRRITQLEDRLGARLIERSSRRFAITGFGRQVQAHAEEVAANTAAAADLASAHGAEPQGLVRMSCPIGMDQRLFEILLPVMQRHPRLRIQILLAPGALFHAERKPSTLMRINFATTQEAAFWQIFQQVVAAMK